MFYEKEFVDIKKWIDQTEGKILFCSGAFGDFFLGMDAAMKHKTALIYWSKPATFDLSVKFLSALNIKSYVINVGTEIWRNGKTFELCKKIEELLRDRGCRTHGNNKCQLPIIQYLPDIINEEYSNFKNYKLDLPKKYCLLCPCGNNNTKKIKRFFLQDEFQTLIDFIQLKKIEPILVGSDSQLQRYDQKRNYKWLQFERFDGKTITVEYFIEAVRTAMFVISPDTSLKTLSAAMHVPTFVLKNRNQNNEFVSGVWDRIFLDKRKWKAIDCFPFNKLIDKIYEFNAIKML